MTSAKLDKARRSRQARCTHARGYSLVCHGGYLVHHVENDWTRGTKLGCNDCGAIVPIGPAAEPSDFAMAAFMAIEQRAAEIAADWDATMDLRGLELTPMESLGACSPDGQHLDLTSPSLLDAPHERVAYLAGWLACVIAAPHEEPCFTSRMGGSLPTREFVWGHA